jgi:putative phosphoesterase
LIVGLIADTHDDIAPWADVLPKVAKAFEGVGLILHCGDLTTLRVLDDLEGIAPVLAVRTSNDPEPEPQRLIEGPRVVETDGLVIGLVRSLGEEEPGSVFGQSVDVIVYGGSHKAVIDTREGILLVNPGSPTLAEEVTVAFLDTAARPPRAEIVPL